MNIPVLTPESSFILVLLDDAVTREREAPAVINEVFWPFERLNPKMKIKSMYFFIKIKIQKGYYLIVTFSLCGNLGCYLNLYPTPNWKNLCLAVTKSLKFLFRDESPKLYFPSIKILLLNVYSAPTWRPKSTVAK